MNRKHLGDCMDCYKKWFLQVLSLPQIRAGAGEIAAMPMFTDEWRVQEKEIYKEFIGVEIIQHERVPNERGQRKYFNLTELPKHCRDDVFIDPDTGFRIDRKLPPGRSYEEYFFLDELQTLLYKAESKRLVIIYDQSISRGDEINDACKKLRALFDSKPRLHAFAYCAQAALIGVSRDRARMEDITKLVSARRDILKDRFISTLDFE